MTHSDDFEKIEFKAAEWIIRLSEEPDNEELQAEFDAWYGESDLHAKLYDDTKKAFELYGQSKPVTRDRWDEPWIDNKPRLELVPPSIEIPETASTEFNPIQLLINWRKTFGAVIVFGCMMVLLGPILLLRVQADYSTGTGEQQTIVLDDGSQVFLSPESAISVDYNQRERHIHLLKGNAFFDVTTNTNLPFTVEAGSTETTVLGTSFNIRLTQNGATVAVQEGNVRVEDDSIFPNFTQDLQAGDRVRVTWQQGVVRDQISINEIAAWRDGQLIAHNMPITELVDILGTYHKGAIVIRSTQFEQHVVTGLFSLTDPIRSLNTLTGLYEAQVIQVSPWLLVVTDNE